jgi:hypothetical protein
MAELEIVMVAAGESQGSSVVWFSQAIEELGVCGSIFNEVV